MERVDIAIVGTGPAGLEAAITAKIRNKTVLLFGSRILTTKLNGTHQIHNYLGFPAVSGQALAESFAEHLSQMGIEITEKRINAIYAMGDYFALQSGDDMFEAKSVIMATGVVTSKPLPGEDALVGRGVSYCATCDAPLYRGKKVIVVGYHEKEEEEAAFLSEVADVTYVPVYKGETHLPDAVHVVREKPQSIEKTDEGMVLVTDQGRLSASGIFVLRESIAPGQLVPGLETEGPHVKVSRDMSTSLPGCFACGDIAGLPYQYIKAAGEGNVAALSAVHYLDTMKKA